ncbi:MAG: response regulator [Gammaproteobacteria bacterium]|jgi:CheY-like chemotaxis protein|nr:response regulator [Gammaproteobacteria bacterium]MBT5601392.1 response regulator [Gammaproteobacteria bacterium]
MAFNHALLDSFERLNILLVDDDAFVIRVLEKTLRLLGFSHLHKAEDGLQALEIMNEVAVDLLITDVMMPNMNGLALLKAIRSGQSNAMPDLATIVVTALTDSETLSTAMALDVNGFLTKPFSPAIIIKKLLLALAEEEFKTEHADYQSIVTDLDDLAENHNFKQNHAVKHDSGGNDRGQKASLVTLFQLRPEMQLAEDIRTRNKTILLSAGFTLNQKRIHRIWELEDNLEKKNFLIYGGW